MKKLYHLLCAIVTLFAFAGHSIGEEGHNGEEPSAKRAKVGAADPGAVQERNEESSIPTARSCEADKDNDRVQAAQITALTIQAEQGHADAQYNLGYLYYKGNGVPQDYVQAACWYRKAAEQGYALPKSALARLEQAAAAAGSSNGFAHV